MAHQHFHVNDQQSSEKESVSYKSNSLLIVFILTLVFLFVEIIGGVLSGSLALIADSFHMMTDTMALGLSLLALIISRRPSKSSHTFGFRRAEIVSAFLNGALLIILSIFIVLESINRINSAHTIDSGLMFYVAMLGLSVNVFGIYLLRKDRKNNLNIKGAFLHLLGDTLGSLGAISAAVIIAITGEVLVDILVSLLIMILLLYNGFNLFKESLHILMEGTPSGMDINEIKSSIMEVGGVVEVHDLHAWTVSSNVHSISCHVRVEEHSSCQPILVEIQKLLRSTFKIHHCTVQMEHCLPSEQYDCDEC
ncbi:MAG: cation diffusion facilitator family transporter [Candidatus Hodarchaeales archaeon]|jgi:cobalt-zinc-cadmium efflux system protein